MPYFFRDETLPLACLTGSPGGRRIIRDGSPASSRSRQSSTPRLSRRVSISSASQMLWRENGPFPYRRIVCGEVLADQLPALEAWPVMASAICRYNSTGRSCPIPGISSSWAPLMFAAVSRPPCTGTKGSSSP
jgi:hypothetical protein